MQKLLFVLAGFMLVAIASAHHEHCALTSAAG